MIEMNEIKTFFETLFQFDKYGYEALLITDLHFTTAVYVSPTYESIWGHTCQSLYDDPRSFLQAVHPADRLRVESKILKEQGVECEIEYRIIRPDKNLRYIHGRIFPIKESDGEIVWKACIIRDASKQIFAEKVLQLREQRYRAVFNSGYDAIFVCNLRKNDFTDAFVEFNENAVRLTGFSRNELAELCISELIERKERKRLPDIFDNLFNSQYFLFETILSTKTGKTIPVEINANLFNFINQPAILFIVRDISERKNLEIQKKEYQKNLEKEVAAQTKKLKAMNTMLAQEILDRKKIEADLKASSEKIKHLSHRLMKSIEDERKKLALEIHDEIGQSVTVIHMELDSINKIISERDIVLKNRIKKTMGYLQNLGNTVRNISANLRPDMLDSMGFILAVKWYIKDFAKRHSRVDVEFITRGINKKQIHPDVEIVVYRIIQEGLANIAEHSKADHVHILITYSHPNLILKIMDNGIGFDPEKASKKAISKKHGLGLVSMNERAALVDSKVIIRSAPGKGTVIRVVIPMEKEHTS